jgi:undecaprenyl diphosphate synthase
VFSDVLWPDFDIEALREAIGEFESRGRRFGARG